MNGRGNTSVDRIDSRSSRVATFFGWAAAWLCALGALALAMLYIAVGDRTVWGEAATVFPPLLWALPLLLLGSVAVFARSWRALVLAGVSVLAFLLVTEDWTSLLRRSAAVPRAMDSTSVRVITWNIAGRSDWEQLLEELEPLEPDFVFLQETPDGEQSLTTGSLEGYWKGFRWWDQGDCGILSRYELTPQDSTKIGPWDKPAVAFVDIPEAQASPLTTTVVLCNVRMMLPMAAISPDQWLTNVEERSTQHAERLEQYVTLADWLSGLRESTSDSAILLGGDFNVRGGSHSLRPLEEAGLKDSWETAGSGWGATVLSNFPMARIDQLWSSRELDPVQCFVVKGKASDHRLVVCDYKIQGDGAE